MLGGQQCGMVARMTRGRQAEALDGVREHHAGPVGLSIALGEGIEECGHVMAAEIGDDRHAGLVVIRAQRHLNLGRRSVEEPLASRGRVQAEDRLVLLVRHGVQPGPQCLTAGFVEGPPQALAVLDLHHVPARSGELRRPLPDPHSRDHAIQGLPVEVDDPRHVAETRGHRIRDGLPHVSLVQFRVTDEGHETRVPARAEVRIHVPAGGCGEERSRRAQTDRSGGEVDAVRVLRPRRIRLQAAEGPQSGQVRRVEVAEQVVDRMQDRGGVRLDAHAVRCVEMGEPQGRHHRDQRGARGLVTADLQPVDIGAVVVGMVDHPGRQPQHAALDCVEYIEVRLPTGVRHAPGPD